MTVVEIEDAEPLRERMTGFEVSDEIGALGAEALEGSVPWDTFHVFETDQAD